MYLNQNQYGQIKLKATHHTAKLKQKYLKRFPSYQAEEYAPILLSRLCTKSLSPNQQKHIIPPDTRNSKQATLCINTCKMYITQHKIRTNTLKYQKRALQAYFRKISLTISSSIETIYIPMLFYGMLILSKGNIIFFCY